MTLKKNPLTQTAVIAHLADKLDLQKSVVKSMFDETLALAAQELKSSGQFTVPGLVRLKLVDRPARPARQGRNPATGEAMTIAAKPASKAVKAAPAKAFKDQVL
jgi:nucleoid DNA-binding protein